MSFYVLYLDQPHTMSRIRRSDEDAIFAFPFFLLRVAFLAQRTLPKESEGEKEEEKFFAETKIYVPLNRADRRRRRRQGQRRQESKEGQTRLKTSTKTFTNSTLVCSEILIVPEMASFKSAFSFRERIIYLEIVSLSAKKCYFSLHFLAREICERKKVRTLSGIN